MGEILKTWLRVRLGAIMDLAPEVFGHYARDGKLLAQILHSYDIITRDQLGTIVPSQDPALCRVNLKHLRVWLRFLGIDTDDECIEEISCGKGTTALRLFYRVYLCLESRDRLHFVTLQKEREKFVPSSKKFRVTTICEDPPPYEPPEHPLAKRLAEGEDTVRWHRSKFRSILRSFKREREKLAEKVPLVRHAERCVAEDSEQRNARKEETEELDLFARRHRPRARDRAEDEEASREESQGVEAQPAMAKEYVDRLKARRKRAVTDAALGAKMRKALLAELWEKLAEKQEREFDEAIARRVLDQSRYERQIVTKLCEVREQRNVMAENRKIVDDLMMEAKETQMRADFEREKELAAKESDDAEAECRRMCELRQRLREEKIGKLREKHRRSCLELLSDLTDLAVKVAEYRRANDGSVPKTIMSGWKALFLRSQPLFVDDEDDEEEFMDETDEEERSASKLERLAATRDAAFEDYHEVNSPWDEFAPPLPEDARETLEVGSRVLGYVVHRLLQFLYPPPLEQPEIPIPSLGIFAVLVGIGTSPLLEPFRAVLERNDIRAVRMEDAINHCLARYESEMPNVEYVDANVVTATEEIAKILRGDAREPIDFLRRRSSSGRSRRSDRLASLSRTGNGSTERRERATEEKQTQTPRVIPYDDLDPDLSDAAYLGKWAYEFLTLGEPISDELATKIFIGYLKDLENAKGWVLIDYPNSYDQMARLEKALTGKQVPPDPKILDFSDVGIEDIDSVPPRIVFEDDNVDEFALFRQSKLLPNPMIGREDESSISSFATMYVKFEMKPKSLGAEDRAWEALPEDASSVDRFYANRNIAHVFYYSVHDSATLKELTRLVAGPLRRTSSTELFGDTLKNLSSREKAERGSSKPLVRRLLSSPRDFLEEAAEEEEEFEEIDSKEGAQSSSAKPGEENWQGVDFPLSSALRETLASLWESLEKIYVEDLKEILALRSLHCSAIVPYKDILTRDAKRFVERPDDKSRLLRDFRRAFDSIDVDARDDVDVKCELHRRVADFQSRLWEICDERRREAEDRRLRLVSDRWAVSEGKILFNVYVGILQSEMDRCIDTMRLIRDYYGEMLRRPLQESRFSRVLLNRVELDSNGPINFQDQPGRESSDRTTGRRDAKEKPKSKAGTPNATRIPAAIDADLLDKEITELLVDATNDSFDPAEGSIYKRILENVLYVRGVVDGISSSIGEELKREGAAISKAEAKFGESANEFLDPFAAKLAKEGQDLLLEWRCAAMFEMTRIRFRLDTLIVAARSDVAFLLDTVRSTFHGMYRTIVDRYWRETKSVNEMANVFCLAIEEARPIRNELSFEGDRFVVRRDALEKPSQDETPTTLEETVAPLQFRMTQLFRLTEIFRRVSSQGTLTERALVYLLEDLVTHGKDDGEESLVPCSWYELRPEEISSLVNETFTSEERIDWREFVIYAMELPMPSHEELLAARDRFRAQDPDLKEVVSSDHCRRTPLWFLENTETPPRIYELLRDGYQRNRDDLCEEEFDFPSRSLASIYEGAPRSKVSRSRSSPWKPNDSDIAEETTRATLARELLCRMYSVSRRAVNYTAMLLAFCKDEDPRQGFGKALALAMGSRVCTDVEEGDKYAEELLERKRLARETALTLEAFQVAEDVLDGLMSTIASEISALEENRPQNGTTFSHWLSAENLDASTKTESSDLLPVETTTEPVVELETSRNIPDEREKSSSFSSLAIAESGSRVRGADQESIVHWIPRDVCLTVLAACLPYHVTQPEISETSKSLREGIALVYDELRDESLSDEEDVVLAHRLLSHDFVKRLLNSTSKFTLKHMGIIVRDILGERRDGKARR